MLIDALALTKDLIRQPSISPDNGCAVGVLKAALEPLGFACHELVFTNENGEEVHNLYARIGDGSPNFCFAGHTDVVPPGNESAWHTPPFEPVEKDGKLFGRGTEDMKAAIAAFAAAASMYLEKHGGTVPHGSISFLIAGDEEASGLGGTPRVLEWMREQNEVLDVCLVGEPTNPDFMGEMLKIGRRGSIITELTVHGKQGHVAYPERADNPTAHLVAMLHELKTTTLDEGGEFFPPSNLEVTTMDVANPAVNVIPESAFARFNIRFNDQHHSDVLKAWIETVCRKHSPEGNYTLKHRVSGESFLTPPGALSDIAVAAIESVTGHKPTLSTTGGTSDARIIKDYCPVVEFGTTGRTPHMINEYVEIADITTLTAIYEAVLGQYFHNA